VNNEHITHIKGARKKNNKKLIFADSPPPPASNCEEKKYLYFFNENTNIKIIFTCSLKNPNNFGFLEKVQYQLATCMPFLVEELYFFINAT